MKKLFLKRMANQLQKIAFSRDRLRNDKNIFPLLLLAAFIILLTAAFSHAVTVCKDGSCDFTSIKAALNSSEHAGEDVIVGPGEYIENNLTVGGTSQGGARTLISENPESPESTIIDATGSGNYVIERLYGGTVNGFTIKGGNGGILLYGGNVVLQNLIIEDNHNDDPGGGVRAPYGPLEIIDCVIKNNSAPNGGGVWAGNSIQLTIKGSKTRIEGNEAVGDSIGRAYGGGICALSNSTLTVENTTIMNNSLSGFNGNYGAGIFTNRTTYLNNVTVLNNKPADNGGGIYKSKSTGSGAVLVMRGGKVDGNEADNGGGVWLGNTSTLYSTATITNNTADTDGGGIYCSYEDNVNISAGIVSGNSPNNISCCPTGELPSGPTDDSAANHDQSGTDADPINTFTGELFSQYDPDIDLGGPMPLFFARYYASGLLNANISSRIGNNWRHNFDWTLTRIGTNIGIVDNRGRLIRFTQNGSAWDLTGKTDIVYQLSETDGVFTLLDPRSQRSYTFNAQGRLTGIEDGHGNVHTLTYDTGVYLAGVSDGLGRALTFTYDSDGKLSQVSDGSRSVSFGYTSDDLTSVVDTMGNTTTYAYAADGLMTSFTRPAGNTPYTQTFNGSGKVATQTDANDNTFTFSYDGLDTTLTGPLGNTRVHTHTATGGFSNRQDQVGLSFSMGSDSTGRRNAITDRLGDTTAYEYHAPSGKLSSTTSAEDGMTSLGYTPRAAYGVTRYDVTGITHADATTESFSYDTTGNLTSHTDPVGNSSSFTYNASGQPLTATNAASGVSTSTYNADGTQATITDPAGNTTSFGYDGLKRLNLVTFADGNTLSFTFDDSDNLLSIADENGHTTTITYDVNGNLSTVTNPLGNTTTYAYDGNDRLLSVTDPLGHSISVTYTQLGKVETITDENGNVTTLGYNALGRLISITDPLGHLSAMTYDAEAVIASSIDPLGNSTTFTSDDMGRIVQTTSPLGHVTSVSYDIMGRVATATDALGHVTTFNRDARGLLTGVSLPGGISATYTRNALGLITAVTDPEANAWLRGYDNQGRLVSSADPLGNSITIAYDSRNRPSLVTYPEGTGTLTLSYDPAGNLTQKNYSDSTTLNFTYDANDRLTAADGITLSYDANDRIVNSNDIAVSRDAGGRISAMTLAEGKTVTYAYDANDRLTQVSDWAGGTTTFAYDAAGRLTSVTRPNGVNTSNTYDNDSRLTGITEGTVASITLTRDGNGQITGAARNVPQPAAPTRASTDSQTFDAASQLSGAAYDKLGRLLDDGARSYAWDLASRLTSVTTDGNTASFSYDAAGRRLSKTADGTTHDYVWNYALGLNSISIVCQGGIDQRYYIHTPGGRLIYSMDAATNARRFYHFDERGNTIFLTNDAGAVISSYAHTSYGKLIASSGALDNPFTWQGQYGVMDEGNGLYYLRARYYDSISKRFISRDPVRSLRPRGVNPYQYAYDNPLQFVDATGRQSVLEAERALSKARKDLAAARTQEIAAQGQEIAAQKKYYAINAIWEERIKRSKHDMYAPGSPARRIFFDAVVKAKIKWKKAEGAVSKAKKSVGKAELFFDKAHRDLRHARLGYANRNDFFSWELEEFLENCEKEDSGRAPDTKANSQREANKLHGIDKDEARKLIKEINTIMDILFKINRELWFTPQDDHESVVPELCGVVPLC